MAPHKQKYHLKANRPSINMSLSFDEDMDEVVENETEQQLCSPPRAFGSRLTSASNNTPKTRRLFEVDSVERSPFRRSPRYMGVKKPLDPLENLDESAESNCSLLSIHSAPEEGGRKRSSLERRLERTSSDGDADKMYFSPRISPNSFITMDGRFVQSKNPFSSPMMTDTPTGFEHHAVGAAQAALAPALPTSFYNSRHSSGGDDAEESKMRSFLPPRHRQPSLFQQVNASHPPNATAAMETAAGVNSFSLAATGYPEHLSKFTGSPIPEHRVRSNQQPYATLHLNETATQGSLRKVRRINRTDDVVAATGHHLSRLSTGSSGGGRMSIDTSSDGSPFDWDDDDDDDLSPTDVAGFPFAPVASPAPHRAPPPTPIKQRPSQHSYSSLRRSTKTTPGPPILTRKGVRTPHPGSLLHQTHEDYDDEINPHGTEGKSRFYSDFDVIGELGKGSFGTVYKVLSRLDGCMYAIKAAHRQAKGAADRGRMLKEVYALAALSDQADTANFHIVRYHQAWMEDDRLYIQTELCSGTLGDEIQRGPLSPQRRYKLLREILLALDFLHRNFMCHLDIKPENIFLKNDQYKLGDFGLVTRVSSEQEIEEGDSRYMSMELLSGDHSDLTKSDIFSLGATMYEICLGRPLPMNGPEWQDIRAGRLSPLPVDQDMATIIQRMMDPVAANRPTPSELLKHPQLLSDEQKALHAEKTKVFHANIQLAAAAFVPPPRRQLQRANTWSGTSLDFTGSSMAWL